MCRIVFAPPKSGGELTAQGETMKKKQKKTPKTILMTAQTAPDASMGEHLKETLSQEMSVPEKDILCAFMPETPELPYPLKELPMAYGKPALAYELPEEKRPEVFREIFPFVKCPGMEELFFDLHEGKFFQAKEFIVIRERGRNMLVSPYYASSGGMVVDWVPEEAVDSFCNDDEIGAFAQETKTARKMPVDDTNGAE